MARRASRERPATGPSKGKAAVSAQPPDYPVARPGGGPDPSPQEGPAVRRDFMLALLLLLAAAATAYIWLGTPGAARGEWAGPDQRPTLRLGLTLTAMIWLVALAGLLGRLQARRTVRALKAILSHAELVRARLAPDITEERSGLRMRHVSAWLVAVLGIVSSGVLWYTDAIERTLGGLSTFVVGAGFSVVLALAVAANAVNRLKTRRLSRDFRAALGSERLALDTLGALDVLTSACLPTGERTRFNERFLHFVGRDEPQMQGRGWLEAVHPDDRQDVLDLAAKPLSDHERRQGWRGREHDYCVRNLAGDFVWLHETLVPRFDERGELIEFIGTAIDVTGHVQSVAALDKQIGDLKADLSRATDELNELKAEQSRTRTSRNRFETGLAEAREEVANLRNALDKAEATLEKVTAGTAERIKEAQKEAREAVRAAQDEAEARISKLEEAAGSRVGKLEEAVKSARVEAQVAAGENKKLTRACETLREEIAQLRQENGGLREQVARHIAQTREAAAEAEAAQTGEAQHLAKRDRLAQRCEELEAQLAAKDAALNAAQGQATQARAAAQTAVRVTEHCAALEAQLAARDSELVAAQAEARRAAAAASAEAERRVHEVSPAALATQLRRQLDGMQRMTGELLAQALDGPAKDAAANTAATVRAMTELVDQALSGAAPRPGTRAGAGASFDLRRTARGVRELLIDDAKARGVRLEAEVAAGVPGLVHGDDIEVRTAMVSLTDAALRLVTDGTLTIRLSEDVNTSAHTTIRCTLGHASARVKTDALEAALAIKSTDESMPDAVKQPVEHQAAKAWRTIRSLQGQHGFVLPEEGGFSIWFTFTLARPAATASLPASAGGVKASGPAPAAGAPETGGGEPEPGASRPLPRMPQELLNCNLGEVVELGADSARLMCAKPPKGNEVTVTLEGAGKGEELRAEVTWSKKTDGRRHDVGLKFLGLTPADQKRLLRIAMQHRKVASSMTPG